MQTTVSVAVASTMKIKNIIYYTKHKYIKLEMKKVITLFFAVAMFAAVVAQEQTANVQTSAAVSNNKGFVSVSPQQFADTIKQENVVVVDVRTVKEYETGHIEGAQNIVWDNNFKASLQSTNLDKTKTLAVYCRSGRRSKAAANVLVEQGFRVVELDKGIIGWQQAGYPVAK